MEWVTDGENEVDDCYEVICVGWGEPGGEWTQWGWRNEEGSWFQRWTDAYLKERLVICNDEDTDGRARVTTDEERVLPEDWTEIRFCRYSVVRLAGCENFVGKWKEFIFNAFVDLEPVQRSEDRCDKRRFRNKKTKKTLPSVDIGYRYITECRRIDIRLSSVTSRIVAKRCVLEQKLLLTAYKPYKKSYMRNRLVPKWMT